MDRLTGKTAIITGASRGIGAAIAQRLAADGARVVVNYARQAQGGEAVAIQADVADLNQVRALFDAAEERFGRPDILVNNAGVAEFRPLEAIDPAHFDQQFAVNVRGLLFAMQEAVRRFGEAGGCVVNITSGAAQAAPPGTSVYSATKAAVEAVTKSLAAECGPRGVRVNAIAPGIVRTDMLDTVIPQERQEAMVRQTALRRVGTPEDIADVVAFLVSEEARWITGQILGVNGGLR